MPQTKEPYHVGWLVKVNSMTASESIKSKSESEALESQNVNGMEFLAYNGWNESIRYESQICLSLTPQHSI